MVRLEAEDEILEIFIELIEPPAADAARSRKAISRIGDTVNGVVAGDPGGPADGDRLEPVSQRVILRPENQEAVLRDRTEAHGAQGPVNRVRVGLLRQADDGHGRGMPPHRLGRAHVATRARHIMEIRVINARLETVDEVPEGNVLAGLDGER